MRDDTDAWMTPMLQAAGTQTTSARFMELMRQATPPVPGQAAADVPVDAVDWVRFGYLLRAELGWDSSYPDHPGHPAERAC